MLIVLQTVEDQQCDVELSGNIELAWKTIYRLDKVSTLRNDLLGVDPRCLADIALRQPANDKENVGKQSFDHRILVAFLLTLGVHEGLTTTWADCLRRLVTAGSMLSIKRRVRDFAAVDVEFALRVVQLIGDIDAETFDYTFPVDDYDDEDDVDDDDDLSVASDALTNLSPRRNVSGHRVMF